MAYVDGYVLPVSKKKLKAYTKMAKMGERIWRKHGALDYKECVGDDLNPGWGAQFPKMLKLKAGETVVFSYILYKSRAHRDLVNKRVMEDMAKKPKFKDMPFDMKRMLVGGFKVVAGQKFRV
jgi:uncharacterized protein YbaA (DUF1428 family)